MDAMCGEIWAIDPARLQQAAAVVAARFSGHPKLMAEEVAAIQRTRTPNSRHGVVAVLPLYGIIRQRMDMLLAITGGTSTEQFGEAFDALVEDKAISAIVLGVHSPGGAVAGVPELAAKIRAARGTKPIVAVANSLMCSAAYWIACAADELVATEMAFVGSCNAIMIRADMTAHDAEAGFKYHFITGGETDHKAEGDPHFPASPDELAHLQANVNVAYDRLLGDVAAYRGLSIDHVRKHFGGGRAFIARRALAGGVIDRIGTMDGVIQELLSGRKLRRGMRSLAPQRMEAKSPPHLWPVVTPAQRSSFARRLLAAGDAQVLIAWGVAYHEAGHAVQAILEGGSVDRLWISMVSTPNGDRVSNGFCAATHPRGAFSPSYYIAGPAAEKVFGRVVGTYWGSKDEQDAVLAARRAGWTAFRYASEFRRMERVIEKNREAVEVVAAALIAAGELTGARVTQMALPLLKRAA